MHTHLAKKEKKKTTLPHYHHRRHHPQVCEELANDIKQSDFRAMCDGECV
jgi:hypothetical protein